MDRVRRADGTRLLAGSDLGRTGTSESTTTVGPGRSL